MPSIQCLLDKTLVRALQRRRVDHADTVRQDSQTRSIRARYTVACRSRNVDVTLATFQIDVEDKQVIVIAGSRQC